VPSYRLSLAADSDLAEIYVYTYREFGERQADSYFASLEVCLQRIGEQPLLGADVGALRAGYRRLIHRRHAIYYRVEAVGVLIVRVLGPGLATKERLP
jgi:toxin ParE1/3/4